MTAKELSIHVCPQAHSQTSGRVVKEVINDYSKFTLAFVLFNYYSENVNIGVSWHKGASVYFFKKAELKKVNKRSLNDLKLKIKTTEMQDDQSCLVVSQPLLLLILTGVWLWTLLKAGPGTKSMLLLTLIFSPLYAIDSIRYFSS